MRLMHLLVLLLLTLLAVGLTYPLVTQLTTHVPGSDIWAYDEYTFLWNTWYFKQALIDRLSSPLHTDLLFYPVSLDLVMYTFNLLAAAMALPVLLAANVATLNSGVILATNLVNLLSSVLGGYGMFLLMRYLLRDQFAGQPAPDAATRSSRGLARDGAAFLAAVIYVFASSRSVYLALGHYMIVTTHWVPFFTLYLLRSLDRRQARDAALAGLFAGLCLLTDMLYGVLLAVVALPLIVDAWWCSRRAAQVAGSAPSAARRGGMLRCLALMAGVAALVSAPLLLPTLQEGLGADYSVEGWGNANQLSADLVGLVTPTALNPLTDSDWSAELRAVQTGDSPFRDVNTVFLGYATLLLAVVGALAGGRRMLAWSVIAVTSAVLALGPLLQVNGRSLFNLDGLEITIPLPFILLHYVPFIQGFRAPNRFSIVLFLALAVLAGYGLFWLLSRVLALRQRSARRLLPHADVTSSGRRLAGALLALAAVVLVLLEHLPVPMPLTDARVPAPYASLAAEDGDFALMQLPVGWRNGFGVYGAEDTRVQWYQSVHGRPILSGNTSRNPPFKFEYFERQPLLQALTGIEQYQPPDENTDLRARQSAQRLMALWNVRYLVVNSPVPGRYPYIDTHQEAADYALDVLPVSPDPVWDEDGVQVYAVRQPPVPFPFTLDFGAEDTSANRGAGWSVDERELSGTTGIWAADRVAELYLPLRFDEARPLELIMRIQPFDYPGAPSQAVSVAFNGASLGTRAVTPGWQELRFDVPAEATRSGLNRVELRFATAARPVDVLSGQGAIGTTGVQSPVDIEINSGGTAQDFAFITVSDGGGKTQDASAGRRGYNLAALDPDSGKVLSMRGFDTYANEFEAERMAEYLEELPAGTIVLAATRDDASRYLTDRAIAALQAVGSAVDLRQTPGAAHALVGVKGASPGTAVEESGPSGAFVRVASDRRPLAAALDWLRLETAR